MKNSFLYKPRNYKNIKLWKNITEKEWNNPLWQLKNSIRTVEQLKQVISLTDYQASEIEKVVNTLRAEGKDPLRISPYYASLIQENPFYPKMLPGEKQENRLDPIFWQSVVTPANLLFQKAGTEQAMKEGDRTFGAAYQRYPNRVALFVAENTSCASYCTHCQRAKSLDAEVKISTKEINKALFYINYNTNINEVLVTGGDALRINQNLLKYILEELSKIEHLRVIRIATRVPVVLPMAITNSLLEMIKNSANKHSQENEKHIYFMTHVNHYQEITKDFKKVISLINSHGFTVRNQSVLLNHVNDYYKTLAETFRRMFWVGVHPYYLLQCHKEKGIVHFISPIQIGEIYMKNLQGWVSGITTPRYAANIEGGGGKVVLMPSGHDTLNLGINIDDEVSESFATVNTWDNKRIENYEALGRTTQEEYDNAVKIMDKFIGRSDVFKPRLIIVDENGKYITTTNRDGLPKLKKLKKAELLNYELNGHGLPITNPKKHENLLNKLFEKSKFAK
ncbi:MAG: KamA family radical SAM protein [Bacteroidales bacterium]|jgi:lysine 2,3-aminomutase|nr:KamA family radical SAM protein [Bacteroidales bacterium]MCK9499972.1 KamA family radical SAM protein [Bacteroidales bacterium]NLB85648.1 KamA family radical SAM protein [Bacteroidales bacterium]